MSSSIIETVKSAWGWIGIEPKEILRENEFGNLLILDNAGKVWRLCPEDLSCKIVADDQKNFDSLFQNRDFVEDWEMQALVSAAREKFGPLTDNRRYCLKIPGPLGGEYGGDNLATAPLEEIVLRAGDIARQIKDLPDGASIKLTFKD